jgi:hypothetical protein
MAGKRKRLSYGRPSEVPSIDPETIKLHESSSLKNVQCQTNFGLFGGEFARQMVMWRRVPFVISKA